MPNGPCSPRTWRGAQARPQAMVVAVARRCVAGPSHARAVQPVNAARSGRRRSARRWQWWATTQTDLEPAAWAYLNSRSPGCTSQLSRRMRSPEERLRGAIGGEQSQRTLTASAGFGSCPASTASIAVLATPRSSRGRSAWTGAKPAAIDTSSCDRWRRCRHVRTSPDRFGSDRPCRQRADHRGRPTTSDVMRHNRDLCAPSSHD